MKLSIIIPAYNESGNITECVRELERVVGNKHGIDYEIIVVDDNSTDATAILVQGMMLESPAIRLVRRRSPGGFGRAIRSGLRAVRGDVVVIFMADLSDYPEDVVACFRKIEEGYCFASAGRLA